MRIKAGNQLSNDVQTLDFGSGFSLAESNGDVAVSNGGSVPFVGETDPATFIASGTEYVWFQMDGTGTLVDIIYGKAA